jgi:acetoacetate decarboxylase
MFVEWQYSSKDGKDYLDPCRSQYAEFMMWVDASYNGAPVSICPYIYVTSDQSMARGWIQGFPKKMASIHMTRSYSVPSPAGPVVGEGGQFAAQVSVNGRRIVEARITLQKPEHDLSGVMGAPVLNMRYFPKLSLGQYYEPAVYEIVKPGSSSELRFGSDFWVGEGHVSLFTAPGEEVADLPPVKFGCGWRGTYMLSLDNQTIIRDFTKK